MLDKLQSQICRGLLVFHLLPLLNPSSSCGNVARVSLSLFCSYYFGRCSSELAQMVPPLLEGGLLIIVIDCMIFLSPFPRCYKDVYVNNFFPRTATPWNFLPVEYFPLTYDLNDFKSRIRKHLLTLGSFYALRANVCNKIMSFESSHVRLSKFSYVLVSFMKEKLKKKKRKNLFHNGFITCWSCAGR